MLDLHPLRLAFPFDVMTALALVGLAFPRMNKLLWTPLKWSPLSISKTSLQKSSPTKLPHRELSSSTCNTMSYPLFYHLPRGIHKATKHLNVMAALSLPWVSVDTQTAVPSLCSLSRTLVSAGSLTLSWPSGIKPQMLGPSGKTEA